MRVSFTLRILYSASIVLLLFQASFAQTNNLGNIDFKVENEKFSSALNRLSIISGLNFTYDASDSLFSTIISYEAIDKPILTILDDLLLNTTHTFKQIGNQFVIYRKKEIEVESNEEDATEDIPVVIATQDIIPARIIFDTIVVYDTLIEIVTDTIRITDTVFVEKEPIIDTLNKNTLNIFSPDSIRENGWSATVFFAPVISGFSLADPDKVFDVRNFSLGVEASKIIGKWNIIGGLKLTHFAEKFNQSYNTVEGGFFVTDTVDQYYTIVETDTSWFYVTDSIWEAANYSEYNYSVNNRLGYLELSGLVSYDFYSYNNFKFYAKAGLQMSVPIYKSGIAIPDENKPTGVDFANLSFKSPTFSFLIAGGMKYRINNRFDFNPELYYFSGFNQVVNNYPLDKKISGLGIKMGLTYYF